MGEKYSRAFEDICVFEKPKEDWVRSRVPVQNLLIKFGFLFGFYCRLDLWVRTCDSENEVQTVNDYRPRRVLFSPSSKICFGAAHALRDANLRHFRPFRSKSHSCVASNFRTVCICVQHKILYCLRSIRKKNIGNVAHFTKNPY